MIHPVTNYVGRNFPPSIVSFISPFGLYPLQRRLDTIPSRRKYRDQKVPPLCP